MVFEGVKGLPLLQSTFNLYTTFFPQLPSKFPILPGTYFAKNVTINTSPKSELNLTLDDYKKNPIDIGSKLFSTITPTLLPNGEYRHVIKFYTPNDSNAFCVWWHTEINMRMNDDEF